MFKPGDIVKCIDNNFVKKSLIVGKKYTVLSTYNESICVHQHNGNSYYYSTHFKLDINDVRKQKLKKLNKI